MAQIKWQEMDTHKGMAAMNAVRAKYMEGMNNNILNFAGLPAANRKRDLEEQAIMDKHEASAADLVATKFANANQQETHDANISSRLAYAESISQQNVDKNKKRADRKAIRERLSAHKLKDKTLDMTSFTAEALENDWGLDTFEEVTKKYKQTNPSSIAAANEATLQNRMREKAIDVDAKKTNARLTPPDLNNLQSGWFDLFGSSITDKATQDRAKKEWSEDVSSFGLEGAIELWKGFINDDLTVNWGSTLGIHPGLEQAREKLMDTK